MRELAKTLETGPDGKDWSRDPSFSRKPLFGSKQETGEFIREDLARADPIFLRGLCLFKIFFY